MSRDGQIEGILGGGLQTEGRDADGKGEGQRKSRVQRERKVDVRPERQRGSWVATDTTAETQGKVEGSLGSSGP